MPKDGTRRRLLNRIVGGNGGGTPAQGMLEFALVLPLLLLLIFGIIESGRLLFIYSGAYTASREAARYGSAAGDIGGGILRYMDCGGIENAARRVGILADITTINIGYDAGPGTPNLAGGCPPDPTSIIGGRHRVVVEVNASYEPIVPLVNINPFTITAKSGRTIFSNIVVGRFPQNPVHVFALDPVTPDPVGGGNWQAKVRITVKDEEGGFVSAATVVGKWYSKGGSVLSCDMVENNTLPNGTSITTNSCPNPTNSSGECTIQQGFSNGSPNALFVVADILHIEKAYDPTADVVKCRNFPKPSS